MEDHKNKQIITTVLVLAAVALVVGGVVIFGKKQPIQSAATDNTSSGTSLGTNTTATVTQPTTTTNSTSLTPSTSTSASGTYKDGSYSTTADYYTPADSDSIAVKLTVSGGVVTNVSATTTTSSRESRQYDSAFLSAYKSYVVGKNLGSLNLNRVSGASLTTEGFNSALDTIRQQAQA